MVIGIIINLAGKSILPILGIAVVIILAGSILLNNSSIRIDGINMFWGLIGIVLASKIFR